MGVPIGTATYVWRRHDELAEVVSDGRVAVLRLADLREPPVILEDTAAAIWHLISEPTSLDSLVAATSSAFDVAADDVAELVAAFVDGLTAAGLLVRNAPSSLAIRALDLPVSLELSGAEGVLLATSLAEAWSSCLDERGRKPARIVLSAELNNPENLGNVLQWVTQQVTQRAIEQLVGTELLIHACAVASPTSGAAVVLVGPSGMGKTTAARILSRRWAYVTDETAAIDGEGRLRRYPKPLSVIEDPQGPKVQRSPDSLGLLTAPGDLTVAAVVLLERSQDGTGVEGGAAEVHVIETVDAVALLAEHTSYLGLLDRPLTRIAELLHRTGGLRRVRYSASEQLAPLVAALLGEEA